MDGFHEKIGLLEHVVAHSNIARQAYAVFCFTISAAFIISFFTTFPMGVATASYTLMISGLYFRKTRDLHVPLMVIALITDVALVLALEVSRSAINTSFGNQLNALQYAHVIVSTMAILLYIPLVAMGCRIIQGFGSSSVRRVHMAIGLLAFSCRTVGYVLMFSMLNLTH